MEKQNTHVYEKNIMGTETEDTKLFLVTWFHVANHGVYMIHAKDEQEARDFQIFYNNEVTFLVVEVNRESMPVVFEGKSMKGEL